MKTTAKVFIWLGMIITFYLIFPIVVGILALKKIEEANSREELKTMSILTIFFCSVLGGIFMLNIKDEELNNSSSINLYSTIKEKFETPEEISKRKERRNLICQKTTKVSLIIIGILLGISLLFSLGGLLIDTSSLIPLIINIILICLYISLFVVWGKQKKEFSKASFVIVSVFHLMSIAQFILSVLSVNLFYYDNWVCWVCFGLAIPKMFISLFILIYNLFNKYYVLKPKAKKTVRNNLEYEMAEAKKLLDKKVVTEEEYNKMRNSIIEKYYK